MIDCPICNCDKTRITTGRCPQCDTDLTPVHKWIRFTDEAKRKIQMSEKFNLGKTKTLKRRFIALAFVTFILGFSIIPVRKTFQSESQSDLNQLYNEMKSDLSANKEFQNVVLILNNEIVEALGEVPSAIHKSYIDLLSYKIPVESFNNNTKITISEQQKTEPTQIPVFRYKVKKGESLSSIAYNFYGDWRKWKTVAERNNIIKPYFIVVGQTLLIDVVNVEK